MKVTITFEVSRDTKRIVLQNSVERVINQSCRLLERSQPNGWEDNASDWDECQDVVVQLWNALRDGVFRVDAGGEKQARDWVV